MDILVLLSSGSQLFQEYLSHGLAFFQTTFMFFALAQGGRRGKKKGKRKGKQGAGFKERAAKAQRTGTRGSKRTGTSFKERAASAQRTQERQSPQQLAGQGSTPTTPVSSFPTSTEPARSFATARKEEPKLTLPPLASWRPLASEDDDDDDEVVLVDDDEVVLIEEDEVILIDDDGEILRMDKETGEEIAPEPAKEEKAPAPPFLWKRPEPKKDEKRPVGFGFGRRVREEREKAKAKPKPAPAAELEEPDSFERLAAAPKTLKRPRSRWDKDSFAKEKTKRFSLEREFQGMDFKTIENVQRRIRQNKEDFALMEKKFPETMDMEHYREEANQWWEDWERSF